jgi:hypothetical protein
LIPSARTNETDRAFKAAQTALKNGDCAGYGNEMRRVEELLRELGRRQDAPDGAPKALEVVSIFSGIP